MYSHYSEEEKKEFIKEFNDSNLKAIDFARLHNLKYTTFLNWIHSDRLNSSDKKMIDVTDLLKEERRKEYIDIKIKDYEFSILKEDIKSLIKVLNND